MNLISLFASAAIAVAFSAMAGTAGAAAPLFRPDLQVRTLFSQSYTTIGANSNVFGGVLAGTAATTGANAHVFGDLTSVDAITFGAGGDLTGNILSGSASTIGAGSLIVGDIKSGAAGTIGANSKISGSVIAGDAVTMGIYSEVGTYLQAGGAANIGAGAKVVGNVAAVGAITVGAGGSVGSETTLGTSPVDPIALTASLEAMRTSFASQGFTAQTALSNMGAGTLLDSSITTDQILFSGVYSAAGLTMAAGTTFYLDGQGLNDQFWVFNISEYLVTGASTRIVLLNAGLNNSVIWNTGSYATLGANSTFMGTLLAQAYISVGAERLTEKEGG